MTEHPVYQAAANESGWHVWGLDRVVEDFKRAVITRPRHAYILSGPDHVGKRTLAFEFGRALVCQSPPASGVPCGDCSRCRRVTRGVHPDVTFANLETQTNRDRGTSKNMSLNIGTVREVSSSVALRPAEGDWRIAIVDDVETMQETAQEAFLKTLEEPPPYTIILLLTTDADLLLPTILSRCVTVSLQPASNAIVIQALAASGVSGARAEAIADASDGRVGWAFLAANDESLLEKQLGAIRGARQWATANEYGRLVTATRIADQFTKDRESVFTQLLAVQRTWRILLLDTFHLGSSADSQPPVASDPQDLVSALRSIETCILDLESNVRPRLALQTMVLKWPALS
ncbi:MAG: ATP-binding protein [Thermomicrobiales bacterium]